VLNFQRVPPTRLTKTKTETVRTIDVEVCVPVEYEVFAHADCGSNAANLYKTISIECDITADIVEYK